MIDLSTNGLPADSERYKLVICLVSGVAGVRIRSSSQSQAVTSSGHHGGAQMRNNTLPPDSRGSNTVISMEYQDFFFSLNTVLVISLVSMTVYRSIHVHRLYWCCFHYNQKVY